MPRVEERFGFLAAENPQDTPRVLHIEKRCGGDRAEYLKVDSFETKFVRVCFRICVLNLTKRIMHVH